MILRPSEAENLSGQTDEQTGRRHLSNSSIQTLLACPRRWELHYERKLELIERSRPMSMGSAFQKAIEFQNPEYGLRALRGEEPCDFCEGGEQRIGPDDWVTCENCDGAYWITDPNRQFFTQEQVDRQLVDEAIVEGAAKLYLSKWPEGPGETREFEYRVRLRNPDTGHYSQTFDLLGKADGVDVQDGDEDDLIENKLTGDVSPAKVQHLPLDQQIRLERYGYWRATGRTIGRVFYRWILKPKIRQRKDETLEEFCDRIRHEYATLPDKYLHEQEPQYAPTGDFLRTEAELWQLAENLRRQSRGKVFVRNTNACRPMGMSPCAFIPICTGDPDAMHLYKTKETHDATD